MNRESTGPGARWSGSPDEARRLAITITTSPDAAATGRSDGLPTTRAQLLAGRQAHLDTLERLRAAATELLDDADRLDLPGDDELGEGHGANVELDRVRALAAAARRALDGIEDALARLDAGRYGICHGCGEPIPDARLEALPEATHCVGCKGRGLRRRP